MTLERKKPLRAVPHSKGNRVTAKTRLCACGCGREIPDRTVRGEPQKYAHGHNGRVSLDDLVQVQDRDWISLCHIWMGGTSGNGYGRCKHDGRMQPAHHVFFVRAGGEIPEGHELDHLCGVRRCVNPDHLEAVTPTENKRRSRSTKLTPEDVVLIRAVRDEALANAGPTKSGRPRKRVPDGVALRKRLAEVYGVTPDQIKHIWGGRSWR